MGQRSKLKSLPLELRHDLDRRLLESGFAGYEKHAAWLAERGHRIGKSSVHRYASALEKQIAALRAQRLEREGLEMDPKVAATFNPSSAIKSVGGRLAFERSRLGLTQKDMARRAGIPVDTYVKYERDEAIPGGAALGRLATAGVDIVWVLNGGVR